MLSLVCARKANYDLFKKCRNLPRVKLLDTKKPIKEAYPKSKKPLQNYLKPFYETKIEPELDFIRIKKLWDKVKNSETNKEKRDS